MPLMITIATGRSKLSKELSVHEGKKENNLNGSADTSSECITVPVSLSLHFGVALTSTFARICGHSSKIIVKTG